MSLALVLIPAALAAVVGIAVLRAGQTRLGLLLVTHGVTFAALLFFAGPSSGGAGAVADQLGAGSWVFLFLWLVLAAYLLPDGRSASPFWRWWVRWCLLGVAAFLVGSAGDVEGYRAEHQGADPPLPWLWPPLAAALGVGGLVAIVLLLVGCVVVVRVRLRRATGDTRLQLLWLVWGATSLPAALLLAWIGHFGLDDNTVVVDAALLVAGAALPLTMGIAVLRHRLFDIRPVLSRTLTYGLLLVTVVGLYAGLLVSADRLVGASAWGGLLAVGVVAVAVHPVEARLLARIERWVYGDRGNPAAALRRLGVATESADPLELVDAISGAVAQALRVHQVWVEPAGSPERTGDGLVRVPLGEPGADYGWLVVEVPPGRSLSVADLTLLEDLARYAAVTVRAARLAEDVQASRAQLVVAREEERKRLRRDLHDGVGPSLAAILLKVEAARSTGSDESRDALLMEIREEARATVGEVRRVVDDLRPPAIDEVGLVGALRQRAASLEGSGVRFEIVAPDHEPVLPAAVEVATYRIASEALTNVARHSGASRCRLTLQTGDELCLTIADNGRGLGARSRLGVGWDSMAERAAELGGVLSLEDSSEGGVAVRAVLPLPSGAAAVGPGRRAPVEVVR